jgi:putative oxidoreductase
MDFGLLLLRAIAGLVLASHGAQKLFGSFGGGGIKGTSGFFGQLGFRPAHVFAVMAGLGELCGGLGLALGFLTPLAAGVAISVMAVATFTVHIEKGLYNTNGGYELPLLYAVVAAGVAFSGPGRISVDHALGLNLYGPGWGAAALIIGVLGTLGALGSRSMARRRARASAA